MPKVIRGTGLHDVQMIHASCVAFGNFGVLLVGASGSGKSDLALRLIDRGAQLVSDDCTELRVEDGKLVAGAPGHLRGLLEVRGIGVLEFPALKCAPLGLWVDLDTSIDGPELQVLGQALPVLTVCPFRPTAPVLVEAYSRGLLRPQR